MNTKSSTPDASTLNSEISIAEVRARNELHKLFSDLKNLPRVATQSVASEFSQVTTAILLRRLIVRAPKSAIGVSLLAGYFLGAAFARRRAAPHSPVNLGVTHRRPTSDAAAAGTRLFDELRGVAMALVTQRFSNFLTTKLDGASERLFKQGPARQPAPVDEIRGTSDGPPALRIVRVKDSSTRPA